MTPKSALDRLFRPKKSKVERASEVAKHLLSDLKDDIWPERDDEGELTRAQAMQRYAILVGGTAIFAYAFARSKSEDIEKFQGDITKQTRAFKAGADVKRTRVLGLFDRPGGLIEIAGDFDAVLSLDENGEPVTIIDPTVDVDILDLDDLRTLERYTRRLARHRRKASR